MNPIACRDAHLRDVKASSTWEAMKRINVSGAEVWIDSDRNCTYLFEGEKKFSIKTEKDVEAIAQALEEHGVMITAFAMPNQLDTDLEAQLAWAKDVVKAAKRLNVNAIRLDVVPHKIKDPHEFVKFAIPACKELVQYVEGTEIRYGVENHGRIMNSPEFLDPLFEGVGSESFGLTLDTANFYWWGHPLEKLYEIYEKYAPRAVHTHCKSINYPEDQRNVQREIGWEYGKYNCPIYAGDIDFTRVVSILKKANYTGDFCIENESLGKYPDAGEVLKKEAALLHELV